MITTKPQRCDRYWHHQSYEAAGASLTSISRREDAVVVRRAFPNQTDSLALILWDQRNDLTDFPLLMFAPNLSLVSHGGPIPCATRASRITAPCPATGIPREPAGARREFVLNGHGSANGTRPCYIASESHQIRMRDDTVADVDREIVGRIARASLRHEEKVPGPIIRRAGLHGGDKCDQPTRRCRISEKLFHRLLQSYGC